MFYYYVTKVLPSEGDNLKVGEMYPKGGSGEILAIMAITEDAPAGQNSIIEEEYDLIVTRHKEEQDDELVDEMDGTDEEWRDAVMSNIIEDQPDDTDKVRLNSDPSKVVTKKSLRDAVDKARRVVSEIIDND